MAEAFIAGAVRTAIGKRNGALAGVHPVDLAAHALRALVDRTGIDPATVDDVIMGCVSQIGPQTFDIARNAWLSAGLPESVPGVTIDRQCGSSQQAVHFAAQAVMSGTQDLVVAAGVESMSVVTMGSSAMLAAQAGMPTPLGPLWRERYGDQEISQFRGAQLICERWDLKRSQLEEFALESHQRAVRAIDEGRFDREIVPLDGFGTDEGPRRDTSLEKMAGLAPLREGWEITAAAASQISDGSAALLIASQAALDRYGLTPLARVHALAVVGSDPVLMLTGPIEATTRVLGRSGMSVGDIDVFEINEAFAPVLLAWSAATGASLERTNPNGGAIALGHPLGATGAILMTKLVHELERTGGRYGLQSMCEGGGQANATIIERVLRVVRTAQQVADSAAGVDERHAEPVELAPQVADVRLHDLGPARLLPAPDLPQQLLAGQHAVLVAHQERQQPELGRRQLHRRAGPVHGPARLVEHQVTAAEHARLRRGDRGGPVHDLVPVKVPWFVPFVVPVNAFPPTLAVVSGANKTNCACRVQCDRTPTIVARSPRASLLTGIQAFWVKVFCDDAGSAFAGVVAVWLTVAVDLVMVTVTVRLVLATCTVTVCVAGACVSSWAAVVGLPASAVVAGIMLPAVIA
jgi:acetyl-CoA C-acetyltransferase